MAELKCSIGVVLSDSCYKKTYIRNGTESETLYLTELDDSVKRTVRYRVGCNVIDLVCRHHYKAFTDYFHTHAKVGRKCCNPLNIHWRNVRADRVISLEFSDRMERKWGLRLVPGKKICQPCKDRLLNDFPEQSCTLDEPLDTPICFEDNEEPFIPPKTNIDRVNNVLSELNMPPLQEFRKMSNNRRLNYIQDVVDKVTDLLRQELSVALDVDNGTDARAFEDLKIDDYAYFLSELRERCTSANSFKEKIKCVTAAPKSWSTQQTQKFFGVSKYLIQMASKIKDEKGLFGEPKPKRGHGLSEDEKNAITSTYDSDEYSRLMPGRKDFVNVSKLILMVNYEI